MGLEGICDDSEQPNGNRRSQARKRAASFPGKNAGQLNHEKGRSRMRAYWVFTDIDGDGERWRLAVERPDPDGEGRNVITIMGDHVADDFTDDADAYKDCPKVHVLKPIVSPA